MSVNLLQVDLAANSWKPVPLRVAAVRSRGFTIVELFVVISIALIIVAVALPAFSSMSYSANRSLAENSLRQGVTLARDVSVGSVRGGDGAAVFLFDADSGRISIVAAEWVGTITDIIDGDQTDTIERDVFAPVAIGETLQLPRYWAVRGFAPARFTASAGASPDDWYDSNLYASPTAWQRGHWVFPESGFFDQAIARTMPTAGMQSPRQSFMIRFDTQTGQVRQGGREALFIDPRPGEEDRAATISSFGPAATSRTDRGAGLRVDWADDASSWAFRVLTSGDLDQDGTPYQVNDERLRRALLGNESHDTVLVSNVSRVALYDERDLAQALGARELSRRRGSTQTGSLYATYADAGNAIGIDFSGLFGGASAFDASPGGQKRLVESIDRWINGDTDRNGDGTVGNNVLFESTDEPKAVRFLVDAYSGELLEVTR
jgi:type II secretory pathway pseudopilin PulG